MLRKILSYGLVEGLSKGLNKLSLLILPLLLTTVDYGKIGLLVSIELIIPLISLLGFERAVLRFYNKKDRLPNFEKTVFSSVLIAHCLLFLLLLVLYISGVRSIFALDLFPDIFLILILIYFQGTNLITLNMLRVNEDHKRYFQGRVFIQVNRFILVFLFVYFSGSYLGYVVGSIMAAILSNVLFTGKSKGTLGGRFEKKTFTTLFVFSWPFIFHGVAGNLLGNADKFVLERFMSLKEVGQYTFAYSLGSSMMFAYIGISVYMEPLIYKEEDALRRSVLLNRFLFLTISSGILAYILISIASQYVLPRFYNSTYTEVLSYIPLISSAFLLYPYYLQSNYEMIFKKKSLNIAVISVFSSILNIALNIYLIPIYGIYAAVFTTLVSYFVQALLFVLMSNGFKFNRKFAEVVLLGLLLSYCVYLKLEFYYVVCIMLAFQSYIYIFKVKPLLVKS